MGLSHWKGRTDIDQEAEGIVQAGLGKLQELWFGYTEFEKPTAYQSRGFKQASGYWNLNFRSEVWSGDACLVGPGM